MAQTEQRQIDALEAGYISLADFLPEPDGSAATRLHEELCARTNTEPQTFDPEAFIHLLRDPSAGGLMEEWARLSAVTQERMATLSAELRELKKELGRT